MMMCGVSLLLRRGAVFSSKVQQVPFRMKCGVRYYNEIKIIFDSNNSNNINS